MELQVGLDSPLTPGPSPRWGEGKVNIKFDSLAPAGGEGARSDGGREGRVRGLRIFSHLQGRRGMSCGEHGTGKPDTPLRPP